MEVRLRLDNNVDADLIAEIKKIANGGAISKALYRIILEWQFLKCGTGSGQNTSDSGGFMTNQGQNEPDNLSLDEQLQDALSSIADEW